MRRWWHRSVHGHEYVETILTFFDGMRMLGEARVCLRCWQDAHEEDRQDMRRRIGGGGW